MVVQILEKRARLCLTYTPVRIAAFVTWTGAGTPGACGCLLVFKARGGVTVAPVLGRTASSISMWDWQRASDRYSDHTDGRSPRRSIGVQPASTHRTYHQMALWSCGGTRFHAVIAIQSRSHTAIHQLQLINFHTIIGEIFSCQWPVYNCMWLLCIFTHSPCCICTSFVLPHHSHSSPGRGSEYREGCGREDPGFFFAAVATAICVFAMPDEPRDTPRCPSQDDDLGFPPPPKDHVVLEVQGIASRVPPPPPGKPSSWHSTFSYTGSNVVLQTLSLASKGQYLKCWIWMFISVGGFKIFAFF